MYRYDEFDQAFVTERVEQFRGQVDRRLSGEITEDQFKPLRLMNGVYLQLHSYMLRIAIPYGTLNPAQLRMLAFIARKYDRGYGHFTTRQNLQFHWPALKDIPDILGHLASVEMHAIQTSGNCIRNVTADHFAGAAADEIADPRPYAEILRQWSSLHPEFIFLPRKFKIAVTGAAHDRAAIQVHDIGLHLKKDAEGNIGFAVYVGGGLGRTPMIGHKINDFLPEQDLLSYVEAILRVYNLFGRRDNKFKARIKILVHETGAEEIRRQVEEEWSRIRDGALALPEDEILRIRAYFALPPLPPKPARSVVLDRARAGNLALGAWVNQNVVPHRTTGYGVLTVSLKPIGGTPGDMTAEQMELLADLAERFSWGEARISHEQNIILPHVALDDLPVIHEALAAQNLATANAGLVTDIIACPGLDYCSLANARSIPVAQRISERFADPDRQREIGDLKIKISGCINACGHHHVGHIGILGVEKKGEEFYQLTLGGSGDETAAVGEIIGPGFAYDEVVDAVETLVDTYLKVRSGRDENFLATYRRVGQTPFKEALYGAASPPLDALALAADPAEDVRARAATLNALYGERDTESLIRVVVDDLFPGKIALVSSFGGESAVLLHLLSRVDKSVPVVFLDTGRLFPETLEYRARLTEHLGLTDVRTVSPDPSRLSDKDPHRALWMTNPDLCCAIRKTEPLKRALEGFDAWFTGRKRFQNSVRAHLPVFEGDGHRIKVNPLITWSQAELTAYAADWQLPEHPLVAQGYPSIGCVPCTSKVAEGEDVRAGRWRGREKTECGIHTTLEADGSGI